MMDDLSAEHIARALTTRRLGRPALYFPRIGSTNDVAHKRAASGAPGGLLVIADEQTSGRGRLVRRWWAPPGSSLLMSLLLRPSLPLAQAGQLTMCLGLGAVEGIEAVTGLRPALKWPNDLLFEGHKLGGMLSELCLDGERLAYAVLGLGINVNVAFDDGRWTMGDGRRTMDDGRWMMDDGRWMMDDGQWSMVNGPPMELAATAISLSMALGRPVDRLALLVAVLARCEVWYDRLLTGESPHNAWAVRLDTLGRRVTVTTSAGALVGLATGVTPEGALRVRDDAGQEHIFWSGDVAAVRPAGQG